MGKKQVCAEWEERLSLYVDGLLNPFEENAVEAHLSRCEGCRKAVELWKAVGGAIRRTPEYLPPADLRDRILLSTTRRPMRLERWRFPTWQLAPVLGIGLVLAWVSLPNPLAPTPLKSIPQPSELAMPAKSVASPLFHTERMEEVSTLGSPVVNAVVAVEARPTFRVSPNTPRIVPTARLSMLESAPPEPIPALMESAGTPSRAPTPIVTEVADASYEPSQALGETDLISAPVANGNEPTRADRFLIEWQNRLNNASRNPHHRPWATMLDSLLFQPFPFVPIVSTQPK